ncbi:MAG: damage-inducible protein DinB [Rhodospirillaceae bacterium]|jgi:uncharacterized damage-inducible protein DinB|nr:damage-inducible protein DinB [Rhodospirillaceae bacterium]MBT4691543.1 damage-inducible protein DinB [Rhodospirillaceae bacterium]MBT5081669.1 damage-inducible protein DinB [Rhodospirillaceae bacterium]MBT5525429.1 damage-inducible protein DinB [Rhodospirillaceae bacterium]MBT5877659.1 damage-inducible protein DinB [Rhodospirillaceae bacterium]
MLAHPSTLANYNAWANRHLAAACATLTPAQLAEDRAAFFRSILETLNHILLVDILYRERLEGVDSGFKTLDEFLHQDLASLTAHQVAEDRRWIALTKDLDPEKMDEMIGFWTLMDNPDRWEVPKHIYFTNLCQHQAHHRGQVHNMLSQTGMAPPPIGYIEFRVDTDGAFVTTPADA